MRPTRTTKPTSTRDRKIGRKVLRAHHLNHVLSSSRKKSKFTLSLPKIQPKIALTVCAAVLVLGGAGFGVAQFYFSETAKAEKTAAAVQQKKLEARSLEADACRRKKLEEKADQIGKITFDQLYDGDECNR